MAVGLLQDLDLVLVPVAELHEPQEPQDPQLPFTIPTKSFDRNFLSLIYKILHSTVTEEDPGHEEPPFSGAGLLQDLDLVLVPVAVLHEPQEPQDPQLPFTGPLVVVGSSVVIGDFTDKKQKNGLYW